MEYECRQYLFKLLQQPEPQPMTHTAVLLDEARRQRALDAVREAPVGYVVKISEPTRNLEQNAAQWPYLEAFADQVQWPVNGEMHTLTPEEWKDILTSAFEGEINPRLAAGWNGGVVMLGARTSKFSKAKFSEWIEFLKCAAAVKGVTVYDKDQHD